MYATLIGRGFHYGQTVCSYVGELGTAASRRVLGQLSVTAK